MFRGVLATAVAVTVLAAVPASADEVTGPEDLGAQPGWVASSGRWVTNSGTVAGTAMDPDLHDHAARWDAAGRSTDLPPSPGHQYVTGVAVNEAGVVVGNSMANVLVGRATLWDASGVPVELPLPPGIPNYPSSEAVAVNDHGLVAGFAYGASGPDTAVRWDTTRGTVTALGVGRVRAMNEAGAVIGWYGDSARYWDPAGNTVELTGATALQDLDDAGTAVGSTGSHAAKWDPAGHLTVLDTGWPFSTALAITADGTVFGEVGAGDGRTRVARWDPAGQLTVLPDGARSEFVAARGGRALVRLDWTEDAVWDAAGGVTLLPLPAADASCGADGLNDVGTVTGSCSGPGRATNAVRWQLGSPAR